MLLVEFGRGAVGQADLVGGIVNRAGRPHRPVHEILAGVLGVGVAVEYIDDGEFAGLHRQPGDIDLAGELLRGAGKLLLFAAKAEGLAQEQPRGVVMRVGEVGFLRFAVREARGAHGVVQAKSLQQFGIVIDLAAFPEPGVQEQAVAPGRLRLRRRRQAVGAGIGRAERRIALRQIGGLAVDFPAVGFGIGDVGLRRPVRRSGPVDLAVEADAQLLEIERRSVLRARGKANVGAFELAVEIFEPHAPVRRERVFHAGAGGPAEPAVDMLFLVADRGRVEKAIAGKGQPAGGVSEPGSVRVADAAARGAGIVQLVANVGVRGGQPRDDRSSRAGNSGTSDRPRRRAAGPMASGQL